MMKTAFRVLAAVLVTCSTAAAQAYRVGPTFAMGGTPLVYTPDVAYDNIRDRYFAVQGHGFIEGVLTNAAGAVLADVPLNASRGMWAGEYAQTPRVAFSPDVNNGLGGFLVTWHESMPPGTWTQVHARLISADGVPLSADLTLSLEAGGITSSTNWTMGAPVAYSSASKEFLVSWMGSYTVSNNIYFNRVSVTGAVLQSAVTAVTTASPDWEREPDVTYNPDANEFFIVFAGWHNALGYGYVASQRVQPGTGQMLGGQPEYDQVGGTAAATLIPAVTYNPLTKQYLVVWYHRTSAGIAFYGRKINADGTPASGLIVESAIYKAYDALDVKYNKVSGDYLLVTHSNTAEDAAVSIKSDGTPFDNGFLATLTGSKLGNYNPRLAPTSKAPSWLMVTAGSFANISGQFIASAATPPVVARPYMYVDEPLTNLVRQPFNVSGWAADLGSATGSGADAIHVWAWPSGGGAPIFVGATTPSISRPDVGAVFGTQFSSSGYSLTINTLPAGSYSLSVYMHSTVTNTFNAVRSVPITVSTPMVAIDLPGPGAVVSSKGFVLAGWGVDLASTSGPGMSAVHVWAFPVGGGPAQFAAAATYGVARPDLGGIFGPQFTNSGYQAIVTSLAPGTYDLGVYGLSTVTGTFNVVRFVRVVVQ